MSPVLQKIFMWEANCKTLASLAIPGFKSMGYLHLIGGLQPIFQDEIPSCKVTSDHQRIYKPPQEQLPEGGFAFPDGETGRKSLGLVYCDLLQQVVSGSKTEQQMEAHLGPEHLEMYQKTGTFKNGNPRHYKTLPSARRMQHLQHFSNAYFHIPVSL